MLFSREDLQVESWSDFLAFMLILPFIGLVFPFLAAVYTLGFFLDKTGWLDT